MSNNREIGSKDVQIHVRKLAVKAVVHNGQKAALVADVLGVALKTVYRWVKIYKTAGDTALKQKKRGSAKGSRGSLSVEQCTQVQVLIMNHDPGQLNLPFLLWTGKAVKALIYKEFSIDLPIKTIGTYLHRWGFTPKKPLNKSYEQQPEVLKKWLEHEFLDIKKRASKENAEIHWGNETGFINEVRYQNTCEGFPQTPTVFISTSHKLKVNMVSSISNQGNTHFNIHESEISPLDFVSFLEKLIRCTTKSKIYFIVNKLPQLYSQEVSNWLYENRAFIKVFYLPLCAPAFGLK